MDVENVTFTRIEQYLPFVYPLIQLIKISLYLKCVNCAFHNPKKEGCHLQKGHILDVSPSPMLLVYKRKSSGPRTAPCGTTDRTKASLDFSPSITTVWLLLINHVHIHLFISPLIPLCSYFDKSLWCGTVSNAFEKSNIIASVCWPLSKFLWISSMVVNNYGFTWTAFPESMLICC